MEEDEYKAAYREINPCQCVFEKGVLTKRIGCSKAKCFNLAEREAVACEASDYQQQCAEWLELVRGKAKFMLHLTSAGEVLPHAKEIQVQLGSLQGLSTVLGTGAIDDVHGLLENARNRYGVLEASPFQKIIMVMAKYRVRRERTKQ
jgi:hypothetical protein